MLRYVSIRAWTSKSGICGITNNLSKLQHFETKRECHRSGIFYDEDNDAEDVDRRNFRRPRQTFSNYRSSNNDFKFQKNSSNFRYQNQYGNRDDFDDQDNFPQRRFSNRMDQSFGQRLVKASFNLKELPAIEKNFYAEHPDVTQRSQDEVDSYREKLSISVSGSNVPKPITCFNELYLPGSLKQVVEEQGYPEPTPIQAQGWPVAFSGRDMVGISQTGSGKTLVFMIPAIVHATNQTHVDVERHECCPQVLVLAPTRELVQQILKVSDKFSRSCKLNSATAYGGASKNNQLRLLRGAHICVATPGRLIDFIQEGSVSLQKCSYLVLDEADRMLDMGFEDQIRKIVGQIRPDRQTLMWSATWPKEIRNLAEDFLEDYVHITVGSGELRANPNIQQNIYMVEEFGKKNRLLSLLENVSSAENECKVLIFAETKRKVDMLAMQISSAGYKVQLIHGDVSQMRRDQALQRFRHSKSCILVATDVAARGLDITDVQHVVNYDLPTNIEDYIHRIGRTARGNATGVAHSFFTGDDQRIAKDLVSVLQEANQEISPELDSLAQNQYLQEFKKKRNYSNRGWSRERGYSNY